MIRLTSGRYAAVTATLALAVSLGGTSYAVTKIGTAQLRDNAVTSAKVRNDTLTGSDVKERTLGQVPRADTADRVGDVAVVEVGGTRTVNSAERPQFPVRAGAFDVELGCVTVNDNPRVTLVARTDVAGSSIATVGFNDDPGSSVLQADQEGGAFGPDSDFDLLAGDDGDVAQTTFTYRSGGGSTVQGTLFTDVDFRNLFDTTDDLCVVSGFVYLTPDTD